ERYVVFKNFFTDNEFTKLIEIIENKHADAYQELEGDIEQLKTRFKETIDKSDKETIKNAISDIEQQLLKVKPLEDSSYIIFYLDVPLEQYKEVHKRYLDDKLFNTDKYNTVPDADGL